MSRILRKLKKINKRKKNVFFFFYSLHNSMSQCPARSENNKTKKNVFSFFTILYIIQCPNDPHIEKIKENKQTKKKCFLFFLFFT